MSSSRLYLLGTQSKRPALRVALFVPWALVTGYLAWNHVVWRDEVRALSFALQGSNVFAMLRGLHGEGHPALWYLLLRGAHALFGTPKVLQIVAYAVAFAAMLLLTLRSPFNSLVLALIFFGRFALFEYSVMARNYGISMLLLFLLAFLYPRHRRRGFVLGAILFLLANCNAQSVLLVGAFLVFWLLEILLADRETRAAALKTYLLNAAMAFVGIALCAVTILPTMNDAAQLTRPSGLKLIVLVVRELTVLGRPFDALLLTSTLTQAMSTLHLWHAPYLQGALLLQSAVLFGSTLGLIRRPAALVGAWTALGTFVLFFTLIYPGQFRHQALWLVFLIAMYWIAGEGDGPGWPFARRDHAPATKCRRTLWVQRIGRAGSAMFLALLIIQALHGLHTIAPLLLHRAPESRVRDLASLIASRPDLKDAVVIADPDFLIEALPYYVPNPTYLLREQRFGRIVVFTRKARLRLDLGEILREAQTLRAQTGKPVIILLQRELNVSASSLTFAGYDWELATTPEQVRSFQDSAQLLQKFGPVAGDSEETFTAYLLP